MTDAGLPLFDPAFVLDQLSGDRALTREALEIFLNDLAVRADRIRAAMNVPGQQDAVRRDAHSLKGSAAYAGAEPLATAARALEMAAHGPPGASLDDAHRAFQQAVTAVSEAVRQWLLETASDFPSSSRS